MTDPPSIPALPPLLPSLLAQETGCIPGLRAKFLLCKGRGRQAPRPRRVGKETECSREDRREGGPAAGGVTSALCHPDTERPGEKPPLTPVLDISKQRAEEVGERENRDNGAGEGHGDKYSTSLWMLFYFSPCGLHARALSVSLARSLSLTLPITRTRGAALVPSTAPLMAALRLAV